MKIKEFIEKLGNVSALKNDQLQAKINKVLTIKTYLGIKEKKELIEDIVGECIYYDDGIIKIDGIEKYMTFTMQTIQAYTDLELSDDIEQDYDLLCESKLLKPLVSMFKEEYDDIQILLQMRCDYILRGNGIDAQFAKLLNGISGHIDNFIKVLAAQVTNFDPENLPISGDDLGKLMDFLNTRK